MDDAGEEPGDSPGEKPGGPRKGEGRAVVVWDLPTRLFHWSLAALVAVSIYTGNVGGLRVMEWHKLSGYAILTLVLFRIVWGVIGGTPSRFASFLRGPRAVAAHLRAVAARRHAPLPGHNPAGGWIVVAMLVLLAVQASSGLFASDDIFIEGPLAKRVSKATGDTLTLVHEIGATAIYIVVAVHVAAVFAYLVVLRDNLIRPMVTGVRRLPEAAARAAGSPAGTLRAAIVLAAAAAAVYAVVNF
jgi:cytochrome b